MKYRPRVVDLVLDKESAIPLYLQLKQHVVHLISSGAWRPGASVPSVRQLAGDLRMSTATVQRAYNELQAHGLLIGRAGRGVFVGELATGVPHLAGERSEVLHGLLATAISHARSLGFHEDEVVRAVRTLMGSGGVASRPARVVFVGLQENVIEKYSAFLRDALRGLDLVVEGALLADLETGDAVLDALEPIRVIVSLIGTFADVRRLVGHRRTPLFGLIVDLTEQTQHALVHLPEQVPIGLVAEPQYLPSARSLLHQVLPAGERVRSAVPRNRTAVRRLVRECPIVVHTLGSKLTVEEYATADTRLIEFEYVPNAASLARLRSMLAADDLGRLVPRAGWGNGNAEQPAHGRQLSATGADADR